MLIPIDYLWVFMLLLVLGEGLLGCWQPFLTVFVNEEHVMSLLFPYELLIPYKKYEKYRKSNTFDYHFLSPFPLVFVSS